MNLHFNSEQGLVLDQALALYLRQLEQGSAHLTRGEREAQVALVQELQRGLERAYHPRRRSWGGPKPPPENKWLYRG